MIDPRTAEEMAAELVTLDKKIKELRKARANLSYDLEWCVRERDRIQRHLREGEKSA